MSLLIDVCLRLLIFASLIRAVPAYADGGTVQFQRKTGTYVITVFSSSSPVRVGPEDMSVMIQNRDDPHPLLDGKVSISVNHRGDPGVPTKATREQAQNKLVYAAIVHFPEAGHWEVKVDVQKGTEAFSVTGSVEVEPSRARLLSYWHWLAFPPIAILLFICNQILKRHLRSRNQWRHGRSNNVRFR